MVMFESELPIARVIIEIPNNDVLVVRRKRGRFAGKWELPGGRINFGEDITAGLIREVKEEVGISIDPKELVYLLGVGVIDERKKVPLIEPFPMIGQDLYLFQTKEVPSVVLGNEHDRFRFISAERFTEDTKTPNKFTALTITSLAAFFYSMRGFAGRSQFQEPLALRDPDAYWRTIVVPWLRKRH